GSAPKRSAPPDEHAGWTKMLGTLSPVLAAADLAVVNLGGPITAKRRPATGPLIFHGPPALVAGLAALGVDGVSTANNHALDQHRDGVVEKLDHLTRAGLWAAGTGATQAD